MNPIYMNLAVEDDLSEAVMRRILMETGCNYQILYCYGKKGISYLQKNLRAFNNAAKSVPYLVLVDLDREECPPMVIKKLFQHPRHPHLIFRVAVREVEAWLLADREGIAKFFSIAPSKIPGSVEELQDPKQDLINLARKSRKKSLRDAIVPPSGSTRKQGADYNGAMIEFVEKQWNLAQACNHSVSLRKAFRAIKNFKVA